MKWQGSQLFKYNVGYPAHMQNMLKNVLKHHK